MNFLKNADIDSLKEHFQTQFPDIYQALVQDLQQKGFNDQQSLRDYISGLDENQLNGVIDYLHQGLETLASTSQDLADQVKNFKSWAKNSITQAQA